MSVHAVALGLPAIGWQTGDYVLDRGTVVATGGVLGVLGRLGVGEHATGATLGRMGTVACSARNAVAARRFSG
ncbi:hypothetical protein [Amycolatopsis sp. RTGN1]|uniref:hypothetical protein n=1 Tax=Amycolatopsis ponsaeliensis TaxID=2992142 RepID=UPI00254CE5D8|nr:hypothetical protein [Amycolatopsis sp. RTGN1]